LYSQPYYWLWSSHVGWVHACAQTRALQTYIKRVYYPFLLRDPEIHALHDSLLAALWVHTHATLAGSPAAQNSLSIALVLPALSALPPALAAVEDLIAGSGAACMPWLVCVPEQGREHRDWWTGHA
jgi:hypothetical protein